MQSGGYRLEELLEEYLHLCNKFDVTASQCISLSALFALPPQPSLLLSKLPKMPLLFPELMITLLIFNDATQSHSCWHPVSCLCNQSCGSCCCPQHSELCWFDSMFLISASFGPKEPSECNHLAARIKTAGVWALWTEAVISNMWAWHDWSYCRLSHRKQVFRSLISTYPELYILCVTVLRSDLLEPAHFSHLLIKLVIWRSLEIETHQTEWNLPRVLLNLHKTWFKLLLKVNTCMPWLLLCSAVFWFNYCWSKAMLHY